MEKHLHIICLDVPYPVNYGGVFDLFYKLPALQQLGVKIHLHCFEYGRGEQPELNKYCETVEYHKRIPALKSLSIRLPYIVASRKNEALLNRLLRDDYPILMEGIHCTYLLNDHRFKNRKCFVRLHNVEHIYYRHLFANASFSFKKIYYWWESKLLEKYEKAIARKATYLAVIKSDLPIYQSLGATNITYLPLFLPPWRVEATAGKGTFCLYHGDLSVPENEKAAKWLVTEIFNSIDIPLVIAGKNPSASLQKLIKKNANCCLVANPANKEMQDMIAKAQIHVIPSFNSTGIKLKLINVLYNGRHCVVNPATVNGSGLESCCQIAITNPDFKSLIINLFNKEFSRDEVTARKLILENTYDNSKNGKELINIIW